MNDYQIEDQSTRDIQSKSPPELLTPTGIRAIQGGDEPNQDWVDRGIINVPVADLPAPDGVSSPDDFDHHISWEDAVRATQQLPQIQEEVHLGKMGDDFDTQDQVNGLEYAHGQRRIYDLYYGLDPIQVDKIGAQYTINAGRHRIYAAKALGLDTIPARVMEKTGQEVTNGCKR